MNTETTMDTAAIRGNLWQAAGRVQRATLAARKRTGDERLGVSVKAGRFRVNRVIQEGRNVTVVPLSDWLTVAGVIAYLEDLQP